MSWDVVYLLALLVVGGGLIARDAWNDRTRRLDAVAPPRSLSELPWWARRPTKRERFHAVDVLLLVRGRKR